MTQIVLASRSNDWRKRLTNLGINPDPNASLQELIAQMQWVIDDRLYEQNRVTDISEIAQKAAGEALAILATPKSSSLFGEGVEEARSAIRDLSTKKGFSDLGQKFFGIFIARFLNFYLSRVTASAVNGPNISQVGDIYSFNEALRLHCEQSARIVRDYCGEWCSKTEYLTGINLQNTSGFIAIALKKLQAELQRQEIDA